MVGSASVNLTTYHQVRDSGNGLYVGIDMRGDDGSENIKHLIIIQSKNNDSAVTYASKNASCALNSG